MSPDIHKQSSDWSAFLALSAIRAIGKARQQRNIFNRNRGRGDVADMSIVARDRHNTRKTRSTGTNQTIMDRASNPPFAWRQISLSPGIQVARLDLFMGVYEVHDNMQDNRPVT